MTRLVPRAVPCPESGVGFGCAFAAALGGVLLASCPLVASGAPTVYTSSVGFFASLPGPVTTVAFDSLPSGEVIASGSAAEGLLFDHDLGGVDLIVTDGTAAGAHGPFETTSAPRFLGTSDLDLLVDGDDLSLHFAAASAVGLFVITAETPGTSLFDGDIRLEAVGAEASLDVDDLQATLADGSRVYFLGVIDSEVSITSASLRTVGGGGAFAFNVDDVVTALPEPDAGRAIVWSLLGSAVALRRRRPARRRSGG